MIRRSFVVGVMLVLLGCLLPRCRAELVISIGSTTIPQGTATQIDVTLTSTASAIHPDKVNNLGFQLQITGPGDLIFSPSGDYSSYLTASNYILGADSDDAQQDTPGGSVSATTNYQIFTGSDSTYSGNSVRLSSGSGTLLLATLTLDATGALAGNYTISLVPSSGRYTSSDLQPTYFENLDFNGYPGNYDRPVGFTSNTGTIIVTAGAAPEPSTIAMGLTAVGFLALACFAWPRARRAVEPR